MKKQVTLKLNRKLYNDFIEGDYKTIEIVGAMAYEKAYQNIYNIEMNYDRNKQYGEGDFIVIFVKEAKKSHVTVEVKKATIHDDIIKGVFDIRYLLLNLLEPKKQGIHGEKGWLLTLLSDELMFHVVIDGKIYFYVIHNFQTVKENLIKTIEMDDRKYNLMNSYGKDLIDSYRKANVELEIKEKSYNYYIQPDKNKQTLCLSLHLDKYFVGFARCNLDIIELDIEIIN